MVRALNITLLFKLEDWLSQTPAKEYPETFVLSSLGKAILTTTPSSLLIFINPHLDNGNRMKDYMMDRYHKDSLLCEA
ncbi:hypothetical protein HI914_02977 [Erysiphe necator]|nr:hypothetical protein HI914_02977 [Erysiphe necator]